MSFESPITHQLDDTSRNNNHILLKPYKPVSKLDLPIETSDPLPDLDKVYAGSVDQHDINKEELEKMGKDINNKYYDVFVKGYSKFNKDLKSYEKNKKHYDARNDQSKNPSFQGPLLLKQEPQLENYVDIEQYTYLICDMNEYIQHGGRIYIVDVDDNGNQIRYVVDSFVLDSQSSLKITFHEEKDTSTIVTKSLPLKDTIDQNTLNLLIGSK